MKILPGIQRALSATCPLLLVATAACSTPPVGPAEATSPAAPTESTSPAAIVELPLTRNLCLYGAVEFLQPQRIVAIEEFESGEAVVSLERSARYLGFRQSRVLGDTTLASLRSMMESGDPVYVSLARESKVDVVDVGSYPMLIRVATTPDPWASQ